MTPVKVGRRTINLGDISLMAVSLPLIIFFTYKNRHYQLDDALIYLRYIRNFYDGLGLVYNVGERFNGLTSPIFTYLTIIFTALFRSALIAINIVCAVALFGAALIGPRIFCVNLIPRLFAAVSISSFGFTFTTFGMETTTLIFLISLAIFLYQRNSDWFVVALAAAVATRSESVFLAAPMCLDYLVSRKRLPSVKIVLIAATVFIAPILFNYFYYGSPIPATANAKFGQGKSGLWGDGWIFLNVDYLLQVAFGGSRFSVYTFFILSLLGILLNWRNRIAQIAVVFLCSLFAFYTLANVPDYHWYYMPFFYFMILFSCAALDKAQSSFCIWKNTGEARHVYHLGVAILFGLYLSASAHMIYFDEAGRNENYARIGYWLRDNTPASAKVASVEIGTIGWYSNRYIVDVLGLVNPYNADFIGERQFYKWLSVYQPEYILRHEPAWPHEQATAPMELFGAYQPEPRFRFPGFVLLTRSSNVERVRSLALLASDNPNVLPEMLHSSEVGPPRVELDGTELTADAPTRLTYTLKTPTKIIGVQYGIRGLAGRHHGVCFEIEAAYANKLLMHDCIEASAKQNEMRRQKILTLDEAAGSRLVFRTICEASCNYAWSYWGKIVFSPR